jgi:hypothetical protein
MKYTKLLEQRGKLLEIIEKPLEDSLTMMTEKLMHYMCEAIGKIQQASEVFAYAKDKGVADIDWYKVTGTVEVREKSYEVSMKIEERHQNRYLIFSVNNIEHLTVIGYVKDGELHLDNISFKKDVMRTPLLYSILPDDELYNRLTECIDDTVEESLAVNGELIEESVTENAELLQSLKGTILESGIAPV